MSRLFAVLNPAVLFLILFVSLAVSVTAQTTVFTYQGRFIDATLPQPTNAHYEMTFKLFDTLSTQIGNTQTITDVSVVNGIFTVQLDFGETAYRAASVFVETAVRPLGSANAFTILAPRQQLTSAPLAIRSRLSETSNNAANADALGGFPASNFVQSNDVRLSDDRDPNPFSANYIQNQTANPQAANFNINGNALIGGNISGNGANISALNAGNITTGTLLTTRGGTGLTATGATGNFLRSNGTIWASSPITSSDIPTNLGSYIQNSTVQQTTSNFNISGSGTVGGTLSGNIVTAATQFNLGGFRALYINSSNSFVGTFSGANNTGVSNSYFGANTGSISSGGGNSFFGDSAGFNATSGSNNSFFGANSGKGNTLAGSNSFFGASSGQSNTVGTDNSFFGRSAGQANFDGINNSFFGRDAGLTNDSGDNNSFFGMNAGKISQSGSQNSFFGTQSGDAITSGSSNTFVGFNAGGTVTSLVGATAIGVDSSPNGNLVTVIGYQANSSAGITNSTAIGANASVTTSNTIVLGTSTTSTEIPGTFKVLMLGAAGNTSLCRNAANQISTCTAGNFADQNENFNAIRTQNLQMLEQLKAQQAQIEALKTIVCAANSAAKICEK